MSKRRRPSEKFLATNGIWDALARKILLMTMVTSASVKHPLPKMRRRTGTMTTSVLQIKYLRLYLSKRMKNVEEHCLRGATNAKPNRIFGENSTIKNLVYILWPWSKSTNDGHRSIHWQDSKILLKLWRHRREYYQDDGIEPWKTSTTTSRAYDLLFKLFMDREKTKVHMMTVEQLMDSHDCFKPYGIEDFKGYIKDVDKRREMKKK
jgi:hypothetical protein